MAYVRLQVILRQIPTNTAERCPSHSQHTDENLRFLLDVHAWRCCPVRLPASPYRLQLSVSRSPFLSTLICRETNDDAHCGCTGRKNAPSLALSRRLSSNVTPRFLRPPTIAGTVFGTTILSKRLPRHSTSSLSRAPRSDTATCPSFSVFLLGLPHVTLIELRLVLISYQDYHMCCSLSQVSDQQGRHNLTYCII